MKFEFRVGNFQIDGLLALSIKNQQRRLGTEPMHATEDMHYTRLRPRYLIDFNLDYYTKKPTTARLAQKIEAWSCSKSGEYLNKVLHGVVETMANLETKNYAAKPDDEDFKRVYSGQLPQEDLARDEHDFCLETAKGLFYQLRKSFYFNGNTLDTDALADRSRRLETKRPSREIEVLRLLLTRADIVRGEKLAA